MNLGGGSRIGDQARSPEKGCKERMADSGPSEKPTGVPFRRASKLS